MAQESGSAAVTTTTTVPGQTATGSDIDQHTGQAQAKGKGAAFWKANAEQRGAAAWPKQANGQLVYSPNQLLGSVFALPPSLGLGTVTPLDVLSFTGNGAQALLRQAVAALLNATHATIAYQLTAADVIARTNAALASGNTGQMNTLKSLLEGYNDVGSDLDANGNTGGSWAV